jgi:hypothetical protein
VPMRWINARVPIPTPLYGKCPTWVGWSFTQLPIEGLNAHFLHKGQHPLLECGGTLGKIETTPCLNEAQAPQW